MEKKITVISGLAADDRDNRVKVKFPTDILKDNFTLGINLFVLREAFCTVFKAGDFQIQANGTYLKVFYRKRSLFDQAMVRQYLQLKHIHTIDLRCRNKKLELLIDSAKIAESELAELIEITDIEDIFIGGSEGCFVRWFRIYSEALSDEQIHKRILGNELEPESQQEFPERPSIYYDFTGRDIGQKDAMLLGGSKIVGIGESLHMEPKGSVLFRPDISLLQAGDCSIQFTIKLESICQMEECLFRTGGTEPFSLILRAENGAERYLDIRTKERTWKGTNPLKIGEWLDVFLVKDANGLASYISDAREPDIVIKEALPAVYYTEKPDWYFGNGKNSFSGYVEEINVLSHALSEADRTEMKGKRVSCYSGFVLLSYRFQQMELDDKLDGDIFFNKNAFVSAVIKKFPKGEVIVPELMIFNDDTRRFPEEEREKFEVCYEFLVQMWKYSYGVVIDKKSDSLTDVQKCELLPHLDGIAEIYNREVLGMGTGSLANSGVGDAQSTNDDWKKIMPPMMLIGGGLAAGLAAGRYLWFFFHTIEAHIAVFGWPREVYVAIGAVAAGALSTVAGGIWLKNEVSAEKKAPPAEESKDSDDPSTSEPAGSLIFSKISFISDARKPEQSGVYIKENEMDTAVKDLVATACTANNPGLICFIREKLTSAVVVKVFFRCSKGKEQYKIYPEIKINSEVISTSSMEAEFDTNEKCVEFSVPQTKLSGSGWVPISVDFKGYKQGGVIKKIGDTVDLMAYMFDRLPAYPYDVGDASKAPSAAELKAYQPFLNGISGEVTAKKIEKRLCAMAHLTKTTVSRYASASEAQLEYIPSGIRQLFTFNEQKTEGTSTCNSLEMSVLFVLLCALAGIRARIIRIESMTASYSMGDGDGSQVFPLVFRKDFWGSDGVPLTEYFFSEVWDLKTEQYVVCDTFSGKAVDKELSFAGESQTFSFPQEECYQAQMIAFGTSAGITNYYTNYTMVESLSSQSGSRKIHSRIAPVAYEDEQKKFVLSDSEPMFDPLLWEEYPMHKRQEIIGIQLFGKLLLNLINEICQSPQKSQPIITQKMEQLKAGVIDGHKTAELSLIREALRERIDQLTREIINVNVTTEQILQTVNLIMEGFYNLPSNLVRSSNRWERNMNQYSPRQWYYFADGLVWAYERGTFANGISYDIFSERYALAPLSESEPSKRGIYLTDIDDLAVLNYVLQQISDFNEIGVYTRNLWSEGHCRKVYLVSAASNTFSYQPFYDREYWGEIKVNMIEDDLGMILLDNG